MDHFIRSWFCRGVVWVLVPALVLTSVPAQAWDKPDPGATGAQAPPPPPKVKVNRTPPRVKPVPLSPVFSETPTDKEIFKARVFSEPLVPLGPTSPEENRALADAITAYLENRKTEDLGPIETFLRTYPRSAWKASLLTNLGILWRRLAYFTRAEKALHEAWDLAKAATDTYGRATADRALGELLDLHMAFGRVEPLEDLLKEVDGRDVLGSAADRVLDAKGTAWVLREKHELALPSGPIALQRILHQVRPGEPPNKTLAAFHADADGATLLEMQALARAAGMKLQMAFRPQGLDVSPEGKPLSLQIPTPSMIHLKVGHFGALVEVRNDRVRLDDPLLGGEVWMTRRALEEEASGYFLVLEGALPAGWRAPEARETRAVRGKCAGLAGDPGITGNCHRQTGGNGGSCNGCSPMATYSFHTMLVNLHITDAPIGYSPPRGPAVAFQVTYNQREATQPGIFYFSNLGIRWTFDWQSWIEDHPTDPFQPVQVVLRGGGREQSTGSDGVTYQPSLYSRAVMVRTQTSPIRYERRFPDGSVEVFAQPDGAMTYPRRVFLTEARDPQGNAATYTYDSDLRLVSVTDAIGQVTTLSYELPEDPLKITKVTDPFGRQAKLDYDASGRLIRITDVIGIVSELEYGAGDFVSALTTPYGTTRFSWGTGPWASPFDRWLQATDPLGGTERLEYLYNTTVVPAADPPETVPVGFASQNAGLNSAVLFYWDKRAQALYPGDHSKAHQTRFLLAAYLKISGMVQSEKAALENRVWYFQDGELLTNAVGAYGRPTRIGRVLDDGQSQVHRYEYNSKGNITRVTDPVGRETVYEYDANEIDLLRVKQKNGATYDLLWSATYDTQHSPLTITDAAGQTWTQAYNSQGQLLTVTTPPRAGITENRTTTYTYDPNGNLQSITGPVAGTTTSLTYDAYGRLRTHTDSDNYTLTYDYDALDRETRITYPDGTYEELIYNRLDLERERGRFGQWTQAFHDALGRTVATRDAAGDTVTWEWCNCGSLDKLVDANGNVTSVSRDAQGRVIQGVRSDGSSVSYTYETTTSRLKRVTDARGQHSDYQYYLDNKLQQISFPNALTPTPTVQFNYDPRYQRLTTVTDGMGVTSFSYYPGTVPAVPGAGRVAGIDGPLPNDTITYAYDELGRVTTQSVNGVAATEAFDALGRIVSDTHALGAFTYSYVDATRRLASITYPNGQTSTYGYFPNAQSRRLQEIHHRRPGGATLSRFTYGYDPNGDILAWSQQTDGSPAKAYDFTYDRAERLTAATWRTTDPTPSILKRYVYSYDAAGNRTGEQIDDAAVIAAYNGMNRLTGQQPGGSLRFAGSVNEASTVAVQGQPAAVGADNRFTGQAAVAAGTNTVEVRARDYAGNERANTYQVGVSGTNKTFGYDVDGNLTSDGTRGFEWDAANRLVAVTQGVLRSEFSYDAWDRRARIVEKNGGAVTADRRFVWCGYEVCEERDASGSSVVRRFYPQGVQEGVTNYFYVVDHLGSVREMTDPSGAVRARYEYDPYGRATKIAGDLDSVFQFTGHMRHAPSGLLLAQFRAYDPELGRWLSEDPLGIDGGLNLYAYVSGNPVLFRDPFGLQEPGTQTPPTTLPGPPPPRGPIPGTGPPGDSPPKIPAPDEGSGVGEILLRLVGVLFFALIQKGDGYRDRSTDVTGDPRPPLPPVPPPPPPPPPTTTPPTTTPTPPPVNAGRKQSNYIVDLVKQRCKTLREQCAELERMLREAKAQGNTPRINDIIQAQKFLGCRNIQKRQGR